MWPIDHRMTVEAARMCYSVTSKPVGVVGTKLSFLSISGEPGSRAILLWLFPEIETFLGYAYYGQACFSSGKGAEKGFKLISGGGQFKYTAYIFMRMATGC